MAQMIVSANKLNRRLSPVANVADKSNIVDTVSRGYSFESTSQTANAAGSWYEDNNGYYYWAGGLASDVPTPALPPVQTVGNASVINTSVLLKPPAFVPHNMPVSQSMCAKCAGWMKANWQDKAVAAVQGTPFDQEMLYAIACQETAQRWGIWIDLFDPATILQTCVFDASGDFPDTTRNAFPVNKAAFEAEYGNELTQMLIGEGNKMRAMPQPGFPHGYQSADYLYKGYGIFQYDLQNITTDNTFFTNKLWYSIDECIDRLLKELKEKWSLHPNDFIATVKAYNGVGIEAEQYAQKVAQFYTWIKAMS